MQPRQDHSREINFVARLLDFKGCDCVEDHEVFAVSCKNCCYNIAGFARNYFASTNCCCVKTDLN